MYDVLIKGGRIVTGERIPAFIGDVAICGDKIAAIGTQVSGEARRMINAEGLCIAPGFIDIHSHSELTLLADPLAHSKLMQGVTTEVTGNCGLTPFPVADDKRRSSLSFIDVPGLEWDWRTEKQFLTRLRKARPAVNVVQLAGHGGIRAAIMGYENRKASKEELRRMQKLLAEMFEDGILGLSTGLGYAPDFYSDEEELCALGEVVKKYGRVFSFHIRGERMTLFRAVREVLHVAERTGASVQISHLKCSDTMNMGRMKELLNLLDQANRDGISVHFDQYPYTAGNSYLGLVFPPWAHEGGMDGLLMRLRDEITRKKIEKDMMDGCDNWSSMLSVQKGTNLILTDLAENQKKWIGYTLADVAKEWESPLEKAACDLMLSANGHVEMVMFQQKEEDLMEAMKHPLGMFGSDGFAMDLGERIKKGTPHPRSFGTFPRVFRKYVKEQGVISLEEAIRRMTGAPAAKLGLKKRGILSSGYYADVVVFSLEEICDKATYENPFQYAEGIEWVFVNGAIAKMPKGVSGERNGRILLKEEET